MSSKTNATYFFNRNIGRRTGRDILAGKVIRKTKHGFDDFDDYFSDSSESEDESFVSSKKTTSADRDTNHSMTAGIIPVNKYNANVRQAKGVNVNPLKYRRIGWRTGKDIKAGKNIRMLDGGFENFDDYFSDSESEDESFVSSKKTTSADRDTNHSMTAGIIPVNKVNMSGGDNKESSTVDHLQVVSSNIEAAMDGHVAGAGQRGALTDYHLDGPLESTSLQADQSNELCLVQCPQPSNVNVSSMDGQIAGAGQWGALTDHHLDGPLESTSLQADQSNKLSLVQCSQPTNVNVSSMDGQIAGAGQRGALTDHHLDGPLESTSLQADQSNKLCLVQCSQPSNVNVSSDAGQQMINSGNGIDDDHHDLSRLHGELPHFVDCMKPSSMGLSDVKDAALLPDQPAASYAIPLVALSAAPSAAQSTAQFAYPFAVQSAIQSTAPSATQSVAQSASLQHAVNLDDFEARSSADFQTVDTDDSSLITEDINSGGEAISHQDVRVSQIFPPSEGANAAKIVARCEHIEDGVRLFSEAISDNQDRIDCCNKNSHASNNDENVVASETDDDRPHLLTESCSDSESLKVNASQLCDTYCSTSSKCSDEAQHRSNVPDLAETADGEQRAVKNMMSTGVSKCLSKDRRLFYKGVRQTSAASILHSSVPSVHISDLNEECNGEKGIQPATLSLKSSDCANFSGKRMTSDVRDQIDASAMTTRVQQLRDPNGTVRMTWLSSRMCDDSSARHLLRSSRVSQAVSQPRRSCVANTVSVTATTEESYMRHHSLSHSSNDILNKSSGHPEASLTILQGEQLNFSKRHISSMSNKSTHGIVPAGVFLSLSHMHAAFSSTRNADDSTDRDHFEMLNESPICKVKRTAKSRARKKEDKLNKSSTSNARRKRSGKNCSPTDALPKEKRSYLIIDGDKTVVEPSPAFGTTQILNSNFGKNTESSLCSVVDLQTGHCSFEEEQMSQDCLNVDEHDGDHLTIYSQGQQDVGNRIIPNSGGKSKSASRRRSGRRKGGNRSVFSIPSTSDNSMAEKLVLDLQLFKKARINRSRRSGAGKDCHLLSNEQCVDAHDEQRPHSEVDHHSDQEPGMDDVLEDGLPAEKQKVICLASVSRTESRDKHVDLSHASTSSVQHGRRGADKGSRMEMEEGGMQRTIMSAVVPVAEGSDSPISSHCGPHHIDQSDARDEAPAVGPPYVEPVDSALRSGVSFRRHRRNSTMSVKRKRLFHDSELKENRRNPSTVADVLSPPAYPITSCLVGGSRHTPVAERRQKKRRVTINSSVLHHSFDNHDGISDFDEMVSNSDSLRHYHQTTVSDSPAVGGNVCSKIVFPDQNKHGLRRSTRTRVKRLEWYKNERIIYDRRKSDPVIVDIQPSREHIYLKQEMLKRQRRRQKLLSERVKKRGEVANGSRRLSSHVTMPSDVTLIESSLVPILQCDTGREVMIECFKAASSATKHGLQGLEPLPSDPYRVDVMLRQEGFTTGVLHLAGKSSKPYQLAANAVVSYSITLGKVMVTIGRSSQILQSGDHFFVPHGAVYRLVNMRKDAASLTFVNMMMSLPCGEGAVDDN